MTKKVGAIGVNREGNRVELWLWGEKKDLGGFTIRVIENELPQESYQRVFKIMNSVGFTEPVTCGEFAEAFVEEVHK